MKKIILFFLLVNSSVSFAATVLKSDSETLAIKTDADEIEISLPVEAKNALNKWNPEFSVFSKKDYSESILDLFDDMETKKVPMAFIADLENNGKEDLVLLGQDSKRQYAVALLQQKDKKWTAVEIQHWSIENVKKSEIPNADPEKKTKEVGVPFYILEAQGDLAKKLKKKVGIQVETYLGNADVYEIKKDKPVKVTL